MESEPQNPNTEEPVISVDQIIKKVWYAGFDGERQVTKWDLRRDKIHSHMRRQLLAMSKEKRESRKLSVRGQVFIEKRTINLTKQQAACIPNSLRNLT